MNLQRQSYFSVSIEGVPIRNIADYSPFGVQLDGRTIQGDFYRFGYQGSEKDDEAKGGGNSYTTYYRQLDPRVGRWFSIDPLMAKFPWQSPYCAMDNNPLFYKDSKGSSGEVTINKEEKTITITSNIVLYGPSANTELAVQTAKAIQDQWNQANGKVKIDGIEYSVKFSVKGEYNSKLKRLKVLFNLNIKNNYFKVSKETNSPLGISYADDGGDFKGSNTGEYKLSEIISEESTTESHEYGHGLGHEHSMYLWDYRGEGIPPVGAPKGTYVDPEYQYNPKAKVGKEGGVINPNKRKVSQEDINNLKLDRLKFNSKGKAKLGKLTNKFH